MKYMSLDQRGQVQAEYIWIDAVGGTRSKTKVSSHPHIRTSFSIPLPLSGGMVLGLIVSISPVHGDFEHATAPIRVT